MGEEEEGKMGREYQLVQRSVEETGGKNIKVKEKNVCDWKEENGEETGGGVRDGRSCLERESDERRRRKKS